MRDWFKLIVLSVVVSLSNISAYAFAAESEKILANNATIDESVAYPEYDDSGCYDYDDPYEKLNRKIFAFNSVLDYFLLRPIAKTYNAVLNDYSRLMVTNAVNNIRTPITTVNNTLQLKGHEALVSFWRFAINSVFGVFGTHDVATKLGVVTPEQNFGATLARYGVAPGPYLVLPILGSTNGRDILDVLAMDNALNPPMQFMKTSVQNNIRVVKTISNRGDIMPFTDHISATAADPYIAIRSAHFQYREKNLRYPYNVCQNKAK